MTLGTGIFLSTLLLVIAFAIQQLSKHRKWRVFGKWVAGLSAALALVAGAFWQWNSYQQRPRPVDTLQSVRLGMSAVDVKLAKGAPVDGWRDANGALIDVLWIFNVGGDPKLVVGFDKPDNSPPDSAKVTFVCAEDDYSSLLGFRKYSSESDIVEKLGSPSSTSIAKSGLSKYLSYKSYNVAFEIEKGQVKGVCITSEGAMKFAEEYKTGLTP